MKLSGVVAVVTGGASGIGLASARRFAAEGAQVVLVDRDLEALEFASEGLPSATICSSDVGDEAAVSDAMRSIRLKLGSVGLLMTAAGMSVGKTIEETTLSEWNEIFRVNVTGTYLWIRAVLPEMSRGGVIITVASQLALAGGRGNTAYIASKGAILSLTRTVALDVADRGIRVNALVPGATRTPRLEKAFSGSPNAEAAKELSLRRHPIGRFGQVAEMAEAALFLADRSVGFMTGASLVVDGGWLAG
jgi:2-keto-3-deoxy-L-fuconate dehydrogenase